MREWSQRLYGNGFDPCTAGGVAADIAPSRKNAVRKFDRCTGDGQLRRKGPGSRQACSCRQGTCADLLLDAIRDLPVKGNAATHAQPYTFDTARMSVHRRSPECSRPLVH